MSQLHRLRSKLGLDALALLPFEGQGIQLVNDKNDFGPIDNGVIYLESGKTYFIIGNVDLEGARLQTSGVVTIMGTSSESHSHSSRD